MPSTSGIQMSSSTRSGRSALAAGAGLRGVFGQLDGVAFVGQDLRQQGADAEFVVDYKNGCHGVLSAPARGGRRGGCGGPLGRGELGK